MGGVNSLAAQEVVTGVGVLGRSRVPFEYSSSPMLQPRAGQPRRRPLQRRPSAWQEAEWNSAGQQSLQQSDNLGVYTLSTGRENYLLA